jgi:hypothetical protein
VLVEEALVGAVSRPAGNMTSRKRRRVLADFRKFKQAVMVAVRFYSYPLRRFDISGMDGTRELPSDNCGAL